MHAKGPDTLLVLAIDLNSAAACLFEATTELTGLLRARSKSSGFRWHEDYATSCRYFTRAHQDYMTRVAAFAAQLARAKATGSETLRDSLEEHFEDSLGQRAS